MSDYDVASHTKVRRIPERGHYDERTVHSIIDSSLICHVGFIEQERPFCNSVYPWSGWENPLPSWSKGESIDG